MDLLSRIGIFIEVAKQESFTKAAEKLGITSSAISKQVQNLEEALQIKLLNRTTRKVSLTEEGLRFYERTSRAINDIREVTEELNELKTTPHGPLKISIPTALGNRFLKTPIAEFAKQYPRVTMDIRFENRKINIIEEEYDLIVQVDALSDSSLVAKKLTSAPVYFCASPQYLAEHGKPKTPQSLTDHNVMTYVGNISTPEWSYRSPDGKRGRVVFNSNFKCNDAGMMLEAALAGIGIFAAASFFVREELAEGKLVRVLDEYVSIPERNLYAIFPANRYISKRLRLFIDHLQAYCDAALRK